MSTLTGVTGTDGRLVESQVGGRGVRAVTERGVTLAILATLLVAAVTLGLWRQARSPYAQAPVPVVVIVGPEGFFPRTLRLQADRPYELVVASRQGAHWLRSPALGLDLVAAQGIVVRAPLRVGPGEYRVADASGPSGASLRLLVRPDVLGSPGSQASPEGPATPLEVALVASREGLIPQRLTLPAHLPFVLGVLSLDQGWILGVEGAGLTLELRPHELVTAPLSGPPGHYRYSLLGHGQAAGELELLPSPAGAGEGAAVGQVAPDFAVPDLRRQPLWLAQFRGHPVILYFWASWCVPCRENLFHLADLASRQPDVRVVAIATGDSPTRLQRWLPPEVARALTPLRAVVDGRRWLARRYGVEQLPVTFVLDDGGTVRVRYEGALTPEMLQRFLRGVADTGTSPGRAQRKT